MSIALLMMGRAAMASIRAINPERLSKAAQMDRATDPRRKNMKARSQRGGRTVSE
jgi:hypothetical protein